ncbi:g4460 [Coccomyxa elongata]
MIQSVKERKDRKFGLGDLLGPIGLTIGGSLDRKTGDKEASRGDDEEVSAGSSEERRPQQQPTDQQTSSSSSGLDLGPIAMSFGSSAADAQGEEAVSVSGMQSIHSMRTDDWQKQYEADGYVDLWVEEEFNAGSRLVGGRSVHKGGVAGFESGEGPSAGAATRHRVTIHNHHAGQVVEVDVPEDRYVLWEAEDRGLLLPYACRMGCCTACAVRIKEGDMYQPQSLGLSAELREAGFGLMCVGFPRSELVLETVEEDEVYDMQFGRSFAEQAVDPNNPETIERDDWALEIANMDE